MPFIYFHAEVVMKNFILGASTAACLGISSVAFAADLPMKAPLAPILPSWTGFYVGGNVGGQWGDADLTTTTVFSPIGYFASSSVPAIALAGAQHFNSSSVTGGLTAGFNWSQSNLLLGFEGDINWFGFKGGATSSAIYPCCAPTSFTINSTASVDWLATVRMRLGVLATPTFLLYGTGGAAIANLNTAWNFTDTFATAAEAAGISSTVVGWTAGGGGEYLFGGGWSVKAEYLFVDLGRNTAIGTLTAFTPPITFAANVFTHTVEIKSNIVRVGLNYHFGGP
jgi:outer membrane immunogenic protein